MAQGLSTEHELNAEASLKAELFIFTTGFSVQPVLHNTS